jgi:voltage-gated potassium channel
MEKLKQILTSIVLWKYALVSSVFFVVFIIPFFQQDWQSILYSAFFTIMFFLSAFSIEKNKKRIIVLALIAFAFEWISLILDLKYLNMVSQVFTVSFFIIIVVSYISFIAKSKVVNQKVILGSIIGYLLLSIIFGIFIELLVFFDPDAFSYPFTTEVESSFNNKLYYSLVTLSTLGYGDIVPKSPIAKSLATFISGVGQFYIAILVALLVGKYAARNSES